MRRFPALALLLAAWCGAACAAAPQVALRVDLAKHLGPATPLYAWFGYDEANNTTAPQGRALMAQLHAMSPVPVHIRVHNLLSTGSGQPEIKFGSTDVYSEDAHGNAVYNFTRLDEIFDAFKSAGVRPMVELGFMPKDLAAVEPGHPRPYEVHFPGDVTQGASNNPPKSFVKWEKLVEAVTAHLVARYGRDTVAQWYFEVWNEPDISYWHGTPQQYFMLYDYAVAGVRAALPDAKVGGPASTSPRSPHAYAFLQSFLDHVEKGRSAATGGAVPLDFLSFHAKGQPTLDSGAVTMGLNRELTDAARGFSLIAGYPRFRRLPIILSEADPEGCAACTSPSDAYRNGTLYPAYTAVAYKALFALADMYHVNLIGMLSWSFEYEGQPLFQGRRDLATGGIDKPILNLFRMLALMQGERVSVTSSAAVPLATLVAQGVRGAADVDGFAAEDADGAQVLAWNYSDHANAGGALDVTMAVAGTPAGVHQVLVEQFAVDQTHSNAYAAWLEMGSPAHPSAAQYARLRQAGQLQLATSPEWLPVTQGTVTLPATLPAQSASLFRLSWRR